MSYNIKIYFLLDFLNKLFFAASLIGIIFYLFKSLVFTNDGATYFVEYIFFSYFFLTNLIILLIEKKTLKFKGNIFFITSFLLLLIIENSLFIPKIKNFVNFKILDDGHYDQRYKYNVYQDLKKNHENTSILIPNSDFLNKNNLELHPLSGISHSNVIHCNENGYFMKIKSDRYGFNNPDEIWDAKKIEYITIGDSFTYGDCVNRPFDIASNLRSKTKKNVLNLGYPSNGPLTSYATLKEYIQNNPKYVIWLYYEGNDLQDLDKELNSDILMKYLNPNFSQNLKSTQHKKNFYLKEILKEKILGYKNNFDKIDKDSQTNQKDKEFYFFTMLKLQKTRSILNHIVNEFMSNKKYIKEDNFEKNINKFKIIFENILDLSKQNNSKLIFVYLPQYSRYSHNLKIESYSEIISIVTDFGVDFIDLNEDLFSKADNPLIYFPNQKRGHYNKVGYEAVSQLLVDRLK